MMKFSVITVVLNAAATIENTIKSVIMQDYGNVEYIILDGGSVDGSIDIIKKYSENISVFLSEPDSGIYNAMNKAIALSSGDMIVFMNSGDSFVDLTALSRIAVNIDEDTDIIIAKELIEGKVCKTYSKDENKSVYIDAFFPHQATFSKTELYKKDGKFDESFRICADYDWILREYYLGRKLKWIDEVVSVYDADGISSSVKCIAEQFRISKKYLQLSGEKDLLAYMEEFYSDMFRKVYFRKLIKESVANETISEKISLVTGDKSVSIWGAGTIGKALCSFLLKNNISVNKIIDNDPKKNNSEYMGIKVLSFDNDNSDFIIVSSEYYENEICETLCNKGRQSKVDYLSYSDFSSSLISKLLKSGYDDQGFKNATGLDVLKYIDK